jgi:hypothetical protein
MATATIYAADTDTVRSSNGTFTTMLSGSSLVLHSSTVYLRVGQVYSASTYFGYESFLKFDLSSIPSGSTINSVTYQMVVGERTEANTSTLYIASVADFGTIDTSDWRNRTALQALTPMASLAHDGTNPAISTTATFTESGTSLRTWVSAAAGGNAFCMLWNEYLENGSSTNTNRFFGFYDEDDGTPGNRPTLDIDYTAPASGIPAHLMRTQQYGPRGLTGQGGPFNG